MKTQMVTAWAEAWKARRFRYEFLGTLIALVVTLSLLARFLKQIELRPGVVLSDPVLAQFEPMDVTWLTFSVLYTALLVATVLLAREPRRLTTAIQAYIVMVALRMGAMYLIPLEPPALMIALRDPAVTYFGTGVQLNKDLFFSGHTATMFLLFLTARTRGAKVLFLICTFIIGGFVLLQHAHYAIDVYAAIVFSYAAYRIVVLAHAGKAWAGSS